MSELAADPTLCSRCRRSGLPFSFVVLVTLLVALAFVVVVVGASNGTFPFSFSFFVGIVFVGCSSCCSGCSCSCSSCCCSPFLCLSFLFPFLASLFASDVVDVLVDVADCLAWEVHVVVGREVVDHPAECLTPSQPVVPQTGVTAKNPSHFSRCAVLFGFYSVTLHVCFCRGQFVRAPSVVSKANQTPKTSRGICHRLAAAMWPWAQATLCSVLSTLHTVAAKIGGLQHCSTRLPVKVPVVAPVAVPVVVPTMGPVWAHCEPNRSQSGFFEELFSHKVSQKKMALCNP